MGAPNEEKTLYSGILFENNSYRNKAGDHCFCDKKFICKFCEDRSLKAFSRSIEATFEQTPDLPSKHVPSHVGVGITPQRYVLGCVRSGPFTTGTDRQGNSIVKPMSYNELE